jgi:hypothetical protein
MRNFENAHARSHSASSIPTQLHFMDPNSEYDVAEEECLTSFGTD